jgi:hypothetical protein
VDGEPLARHDATRHERVLDLRTGVLSRAVEWATP